ncbi:glycosyltransferase family 2 protein [Flavobacterium sp.]
MNSPIISIIIPMYKVADYVTRCIESLEQQDIPHSDYEIICINDGSPDNCKEIIEDLQKKYSNIILLDQENQGVSMARNNGIAIAKGKYILPIDPDDYVVPNSFQGIVSVTQSLDCDVVYLGFEIFDVNHKSIWRTDYSQLEDRVDGGPEGYFAVRGIDVKDPDRSWGILYRMELIKKFNLNYPKDVPFLEDGLFLGKVFSVAKRVAYSNKDFYQRTTRVGSATNSKLFYTKDSTVGFFNAITDLHLFRAKFNENEFILPLINHLHAKFLLHLLAPTAITRNLKEYKTIVALIKLKNMGLKSYGGVSDVFKKLLQIYNTSEWLFFIYYPLYIKFRKFKNNNFANN